LGDGNAGLVPVQVQAASTMGINIDKWGAWDSTSKTMPELVA
jgi:hypothetical protein